MSEDPMDLPEPGDDLTAALEAHMRDRDMMTLRSVERVAAERGVPAWLVGGPVRDLLLDRPVMDVDVMVEGDGVAFADGLARSEGGKAIGYRRFGTALVVLSGGRKVDVATARTERYPEPGELPEVVPGTLEEDLLRRDFGINAMAVRLGPDRFGAFTDPHGGRHDLEEGVVRVLHEDSFRDDPTRALRAVRFETRYGFTIEERTLVLLEEAVAEGMLETVSRQRIRDEIVLLLEEPGPAAPIRRLESTAIWSALMGEGTPLPGEVEALMEEEAEAEAWYEQLPCRSDLGEVEGWVVRWLLLFERAGMDRAHEASESFHMGQAARRAAAALADRRDTALHFLQRTYHGTDSALFEILRDFSPEAVLYLKTVSAANPYAPDRLERYLCRLEPTEPLVSGEDLKGLGMEPGPAMGELLERLFHAQLDGAFTSREEALAEARRLIRRRDEGR
ncbi:MAG: hypothetical protein R6W82_07100 [bacterium]